MPDQQSIHYQILPHFVRSLPAFRPASPRPFAIPCLPFTEDSAAEPVGLIRDRAASEAPIAEEALIVAYRLRFVK